MRIISSDNFYIVVGLLALSIIQGKVVDGVSCYKGKCIGCAIGKFDASQFKTTSCDDAKNPQNAACLFKKTVKEDNGEISAFWGCDFNGEPDGCRTEGPLNLTSGIVTITNCYCRLDNCNTNSVTSDPVKPGISNSSLTNPGGDPNSNGDKHVNPNGTDNSNSSIPVNFAPRQIRNSFGFASQIGLHLTVMVASFWVMF